MPDEKVKCAITMGPDYSGPGEITLGLPHGFKKPMSRFQTEKTAPDFPLAEAELLPAEIKNFEKYGFTVTPEKAAKPVKKAEPKE